MIERHHQARGLRSWARWSPCGAYRYLLERAWGEGGTLLYILLNPSTATEAENDPTVARCDRRARALGYGGFAVANLFAWRATRPADLRHAADPVGPENDAALMEAVAGASAVLCGWGAHGALLGRGPAVAARLRTADVAVCHLGLTRDGQPRHPLYVAYAVAPQPWRE
ncbi:MAG: DUF1643 domain-containing protein [Albidovulum sp.]|uniref:DUF1643 domain-containing protein n=1 Tax=Albidovulum sp. TaxID=1872424 RepID=UPI00132C8DE1|nr:DUF1643 domain-containing protein [Defluviimonas sp.]KAB2885346.1 MAG: DUF1643 domain-containing protein [Defluviimonas sp.]